MCIRLNIVRSEKYLGQPPFMDFVSNNNWKGMSQEMEVSNVWLKRFEHIISNYARMFTTTLDICTIDALCTYPLLTVMVEKQHFHWWEIHKNFYFAIWLNYFFFSFVCLFLLWSGFKDSLYSEYCVTRRNMK